MKTSIDQAVDRFLCWKLPEAFDPDCGISFTRDHDHEHSAYGRGKYEPTGTNLLTAEQAKAMLEHVCEPLLTALQERDAEIERLTAMPFASEAVRAFVYGKKIDAQRKVLAQALEALQELNQSDGKDRTAGQLSEAVLQAEDAITALRTAIQEAESVKPVAWLHDCAALLQNDVEFWIDSCPHCGKPRTHSPTTPVDDWQRDQTKPAEQRRVLEQALKALKYAGAGSYERSAAAITAIQEVL
jgi:DNA repair exonuclease SbcCD ATPase subunit